MYMDKPIILFFKYKTTMLILSSCKHQDIYLNQHRVDTLYTVSMYIKVAILVSQLRVDTLYTVSVYIKVAILVNQLRVDTLYTMVGVYQGSFLS